MTALIFTFIAAWNEFIVALTLSASGEAGNQQPLTVAINNYIGEYSIDWGHLFAGCRHRHDPGDHPVRRDRGTRRQRPHRRLDQIVIGRQ